MAFSDLKNSDPELMFSSCRWSLFTAVVDSRKTTEAVGKDLG